MATLVSNANVVEVEGGPYYQVNLQFIPRVGDLIDLYSFADTVSGHQPRHFYEVVQVVHTLHDVTDKTERTQTGHQFVTVYVKRSQSSFFQS